MLHVVRIRKTRNLFLYFTGLISALTIVFIALAGSGIVTADEPEFGSAAPLNPAFVEYMQNRQTLQAGAAGQPFYGRIPSPMDLSHLKRIPVIYKEAE
jgi:hypothetical protein